MLIVATPIPPRAPPGMDAHLFSVQVTGTATAVTGPSIGFMSTNPLEYARARKITPKATVGDLMDNLEAMVESDGFYIDGAGWFRRPSGDTQQTGWYPGSLRQNDVVSVMISEAGEILVEVNNKRVVRLNTTHADFSNTGYVWGFISLNGTVTSVRLVDRLP